MIAEIRLPTTQYGYINFQMEGTAEEIVMEHNRLTKLYVGGAGLPNKEFREFIDRQLGEQTGNTIEMYNQMNPEQQFAVQTIKNAIKRIKSHGETNNQ